MFFFNNFWTNFFISSSASDFISKSASGSFNSINASLSSVFSFCNFTAWSTTGRISASSLDKFVSSDGLNEEETNLSSISSFLTIIERYFSRLI